MAGILSIVGTPIGNLDDLSPRAARTLLRADIIACEDTRVTRKLLTALPERPRARLVATHARNERARARELTKEVAAGARVALVTDAGMPGVSDPGHRIVHACLAAGQAVEVIPGPSAVPAALVASGMPSARFVFEGFLPRTGRARRERLEALATEPRTIVLFESPHRLGATLRVLAEMLGPDRPAAIARELTKLHEEVARGTLSELAARPEPVRGEVTIVIEGRAALAEDEPAARELAEEVAALVAGGSPRKDAIATVAAARGVPKRTVYQAVLDEA